MADGLNPVAGWSKRAKMRNKVVNFDRQEVLIARLDGSDESQDNYTKVNCNGYGRIREFRKFTIHMSSNANKVPAKPLFRGLPPAESYRTQVFQLAGCNWNCWYCFVDDALLEADTSRAKFMSAADMVDLYLQQEDPPAVLDLSGGQPDLVPEWCLWMLRELDKRGLRGYVHVWLDDNLSGHYLRRFISEHDIRYMASFPNHTRVGCFKGFDEKSFVQNTGSGRGGFVRQFAVMSDLIDFGFDVYAYATFTGAPRDSGLVEAMSEFVDRLQDVHPNLPLRTIPLEVRPYTALLTRVSEEAAHPYIVHQYNIVSLWEDELKRRFTIDELQMPYESVLLRRNPDHGFAG